MKNEQLDIWRGKFGDEYTERNNFAEWKISHGVRAFEKILKGIEINSVLEVGSNVGLNLCSINKALKGKNYNYAVEPNKKAFDQLTLKKNELRLKNAWQQDVFNIPLADSSIDLVFTAGVLIHIAPENLSGATKEIVRIAKKYILCMEYFSHSPAEIKYHGKERLLFKRDFGGYYLDHYPFLKCVDYGFLWQREYKIFDDLNWWLFKKKD